MPCRNGALASSISVFALVMLSMGVLRHIAVSLVKPTHVGRKASHHASELVLGQLVDQVLRQRSVGDPSLSEQDTAHRTLQSRSMSERTQTSQNPILRTKLHRPVLRGSFLCPSRLHDLMNQRLALSLILAIGPAPSRYAVDFRP